MSLLQTIEADLTAAGKWLEAEAEGVASEVWNVIKTVFTAAEPAIVANVTTAIQTFIKDAEGLVSSGAPLEELEQAFVQWSEAEGKSILSDVETLGSTLVQALLALVIKV